MSFTAHLSVCVPLFTAISLLIQLLWVVKFWRVATPLCVSRHLKWTCTYILGEGKLIPAAIYSFWSHLCSVTVPTPDKVLIWTVNWQTINNQLVWLTTQLYTVNWALQPLSGSFDNHATEESQVPGWTIYFATRVHRLYLLYILLWTV